MTHSSSQSEERSVHEIAISNQELNQKLLHIQQQLLALKSVSAPAISTTSSSDLAFLKKSGFKIVTIKYWIISTYKNTRQLMLEKLGKSTRTIDSQLEAQRNQLLDTERRYLSVVRLTRALGSHFYHVDQTSLPETVSDSAQKSPELQQAFLHNSETQRHLTKNGEILSSALSFFISSVNTLCNKTIEDTLLTIRQYEIGRIEFDAYRSLASDDDQKNYTKHKDNYEKLRSDVTVKLQFLDENRIKVMQYKVLGLNCSVAAYFFGNAQVLEETLKHFNIQIRNSPSWMQH